MLNSQKLMHIVIAAFLSLLYSCFIVQLVRCSYMQMHPSEFALFVLAGYFAIFLVYTLKTYAVFHYPPTEPNLLPTKININLVFKFKLIQERRQQLQELLSLNKKKKDSLVVEYIKLQKSLSFCDSCEYLQPPRAYHCDICKACIMGKHYHSKLIGFCIGENNQRVYLSYCLITTILTFYALLTMVATYNLSDNFDKLEFSTAMLFFLVGGVYFTCFLIFAKNLRELYCLLRANKTYVESQNKIISDLSIYERTKGVQALSFPSVLKDLLNCDALGEVSSWMIQAEELNEED